MSRVSHHQSFLEAGRLMMFSKAEIFPASPDLCARVWIHNQLTTMPGKQDSCRVVSGIWKRVWEEDPLGDAAGADRSTLVLWLQTPCGIYVDMRLPKGSPGRSSQSAADNDFSPNPRALSGIDSVPQRRDFSSELLSALFAQKSFAGHLEYKTGDKTKGKALKKDKALASLAKSKNEAAVPLCTCTWHRDIDYQPPSGSLDVGVCASGPPNEGGTVDLRETGEDASYAEGWRRLSTTANGPFMALKLVSESGEGENARVGYWIRVGGQFAYAVGRPTDEKVTKSLECHEKSSKVKDCTSKTLAEATKQLTSEDDTVGRLGIAWNYVCCMGKVRQDGTWRITSSLHPELVGCTLFGDRNDHLACSLLMASSDAGGKNVVEQVLVPNGETRRWEAVQLIDCSLPGV
jgi:hypothetical protein